MIRYCNDDEVGRGGNRRDVIRTILARYQSSAFAGRLSVPADNRDNFVPGPVEHNCKCRADLARTDDADIKASMSRLHLVGFWGEIG